MHVRRGLARLLAAIATVATLIVAALIWSGAAVNAGTQAGFTGNAPRPSSCAKGDHPEDALQGEVTTADRKDGRSLRGYNCNLSLIGQYRGDGASWVDPTYGHCAYLTQSVIGDVLSGHAGVKVVDVSNPAHPHVTDVLRSPAMLGDTWESLKVNEKRGLLAGVSSPTAAGAVFFDVYDVKHDCAHPKLLDSIGGTKLSIPSNVLGHEGGWSPDGKTYWSSGVAAGSLTAIDVSNPAHPHIVWTGLTTVLDHGFDISPDGDRMYMTTTVPAGFVTLNISQVQDRRPLPVVTAISQADFPHSTAPQHTIAISEHGVPWVIGVDEIGQAGIHFTNISNPRHPVVHPGITLQIEQPQHAKVAEAESLSDVAGIFGYDPHYCSVDRIVNPTLLACGYFQAGIRVFDIRDLAHPREIAYYNPPGEKPHATGLNGSWHSDAQGDLATDWCTSPPTFVGRNQLWVTCQDSGFMALRFAPHVLPGTVEVAPHLASRAVATDASFDQMTTAVRNVTPQIVAPPVTPRQQSRHGRTVAVAVGLIVGVALLVFGWRRRRPRLMTRVVAVVAVAVALPFAVPAARTTHAVAVPKADVVFAQDMIAHHRQAVAMARDVEADPRSSPVDLAYARQIDVQQSREIALMSSWLRQWHQPEVARTVAPVMDNPDAMCGMGAPAYNRQFLIAMLAHHEAAIPIIKAVMGGGGTPAVEAVAQSMLVDQTMEMRWMDSRLGLKASTHAGERIA
jgi:uncharacterized protein (DUF305 family)